MSDQDQKPKRNISEATRQKNNERSKKWREAHPTAMKDYMKEYRKDPENLERMNAQNRQYHAENREERNANRKQWGEDHPELERECQRRWYHENGGREWRRRYNLQQKYHVTPEEYDQMLAAQGGGCAICGVKEAGGRGKFFHIDHDHATGKVRALLCHHCNVALGSFFDSPELLQRAIEYLDSFATDSLTSSAL